MTDKKLLDLCREALDRTKALGADEVEVYGQATKSLSTSIEKSDLQISRGQRETSIGIRAFVGRKVGFASTNDLTKIETACADAVTLAKASPADEHSVLPDLQSIVPVDGIYDPGADSFGADQAVAQAIRILETATSVDKRITLGDGGFFTELTERAIANTSGLSFSERGSLFSYYALATATEGEKVGNMDFQFDASRSVAGIDVEPSTRRACENALGSLGATPGESFSGPAVLSPNAVAMIFASTLLFQANGKNMLHGMSRWKDALGEAIAVPGFHVVDNGRLPGGVATSSFDREGAPRQPLTLIEGGKLASFLHNAYTAHALGVRNTGHASGSAKSVPGIGASNLEILPGEGSRDDLIAGIKKGLLVTRFSGTSDPVSGDFSGVAKGAYLIVDGKIARPVTGTLIAGNVFEALKGLTGISQEREPFFNMLLPYLRLGDVSVSA